MAEYQKKKQLISDAGRKQRVTVEIAVRSLIRALELVDAGIYESVDDAVAAGIESLGRGPAILRDQTPEVGGRIPVSFGQIPVISDLAWNPSGADLHAVEPSPLSALPHPLVPITVPRYLPVKFIVRSVATTLAKAGTEYLDAATLRDMIRYSAFSWTAYVNRLDRQADLPRGRRLATAFPDTARDPEKSMSRFLEAYVGSLYATGPKVGGILPFLGFLSITGSTGDEKIGISSAGIEFAKIPNPVLDEAEPSFPPFRNDEVAAILRAIQTRSAAELEHMRYYVGLIGGLGHASRDVLIPRMRNFYVRYWSPLDLNVGMVESMRATVHSRCQELGFVKTERQGRIASYSVTEAGAGWLRGDFPQTAGE